MKILLAEDEKELSTKNIFDHIWGKAENTELKIVWMYINFLRSKLRAINADIEIDGEENGGFILQTIEEETE